MFAKLKSTVFLAVAAMVGLAACGTEAMNPEAAALRPVQTIERELDALAASLESRGFSGLIAVQVDGDLRRFHSIGAARADEGVDYTLDTPFGIGSISKPMTGLLASKLIADGVLREDLTLAEVFENVPSDKQDITLAQLLTHGAGIPPALGHDHEWISRDQIVAAAMDADLRFNPGTGYEYSNTGFSLVAAIIETVVGKPFDSVLQDELMMPLGLVATGYESAYAPALVDETPDGRSFYESSWAANNPPSWHLTGNGGMTSTASDMLRLGHLLDTNGLPDGVAELALRPLNPEDPNGETHYGYGIVVIEQGPFGRTFWHNGGNPDFQSDFWVFDDHGVTVVGHRNGGEPSLDEVMIEVVRILFGEDIIAEQGVQMTEGGEMPDGPIGEVATAMLDALQDEDPAARAAFVRRYVMGPDEPEGAMERFVEPLHRLHGHVVGGELVGVARDEETVHLSIDGGPGGPTVISLAVEVEDGEPRVAGLSVER